MRLISDCPDALPLGPGWQAARPGALAGAERALWETLSGKEPAWIGERGSGRFKLLAVVGHSPQSQFDLLHDWLRRADDPPDGIVCLALAGDNFHGRYGRAWSAHRGNIHLTASFSPRLPVEHFGMGLTMLPAVTVVEAVHDLLGESAPVGIKWINDVEFAEKKFAGVLTSTLIQGDVLEHVVFGIGLNVETVPVVESTRFVPAATCLKDLPGGGEVTVDRALWRLLDRLESGYALLERAGPDPVFEEYVACSNVIGRDVELWEESAIAAAGSGSTTRIAAGKVRAVNPDLSLMLEGHPEPFDRGRLAYRV